MNDTLMRQWAMLRAIPRHPRRVDAPSIHATSWVGLEWLCRCVRCSVI